MDATFTRVVRAEEAGMRLDRFLSSHITELSREKLKRAVQQGQCRVQRLEVRDANTRLLAGQEVCLTLPESRNGLMPEAGDIDVIWQDEHLLVINKPAGLTVHPCPSCPQGTLVHRLAGRFPCLLEQEGQRPGIVHRLDKDTSGLMLIALSEEARLRLTDMFAAREVHKTYLALVYGVPPQNGVSTEPVGRHPQSRIKMAVVPESKGGRPAHSRWEVLWSTPDRRFSLVKVQIFTGRTHQIRVHMTHAGFPLVGDAVYHRADAGTAVPSASRQMLHAWSLHFTHPFTGEDMAFTCPPPQDMRCCALALAQQPWRVVITGLPGCGKSTLLHACADAGHPTWSADAVVRDLYAVGGAAWDFLRHRFGDAYVPDARSPVDRTALRLGMEADPFVRQEVEAAVHTLVRQDLARFWARTPPPTHGAHATTLFPVAEIPLYAETGWRQQAHNTLLVGVFCPQDARWSRLARNRGWTEEQCARMDSWQWPEKRKYAVCDLVVDNSGDAAALREAVPCIARDVQHRNAEQQAEMVKTLTALWD